MLGDAGVWPSRPIDAIAEVIGGGTPSTKDLANFGGAIPWLTPKDLSGRRSRWVSAGSRSITERGLKRSAARLMPAKTVLVSSRAPIGYVALASNEVTTSQGFRSLVLNEGHVPEFFYYVMQNMTAVLDAAASGSTFREISGTAMKGVRVPVPPARDQAEIAAVLGALDDKIDSNGRVIELYEKLVAREFTTRFLHGRSTDWRVACLGDLGVVRGGGTPKTSVPEFWDDHGLVWLTPTDLRNIRASVVYDSARKISLEGLAASSTRLLAPGAVLYTSRATLGLTAIARAPLTTNQGFIAIEPGAGFSPEFVLLLIRGCSRAIAAQANGSTFLEVNRSAFKRVATRLPPIAERAAFDAVAKPIFEHIEALDRERRTLTQLRDALGRRLVSGQLRLNGV